MASGDTLNTFYANNNEPPSANAATFDTRAGAADAQLLVLDMDAAADESVEFSGYLHRGISATPAVTVRIGYLASTATSGNVVLHAQFKSVSDDVDDLDTKAFAAAQAVTTAAPSASGEVKYAEIPFTNAQADGIDQSEGYRLRITRKGTDGSDDMAGDLEFWIADVRET